MAKEIHEKFDKAEAVVERTGKLILKIFTGLAAVVAGIAFTWSQLKDNLDLHHVHEEDEVFQEYLKEVETEEGYNTAVDSVYEDSLYKAFYSLDTIEEEFEEEFEEDTIVPVDTLVVDTIVDIQQCVD